jgi:hypothetical protein
MADTEVQTTSPIPERPGEHEEIRTQDQEWFDLQPIEKKLCGYSLGLGIILLIVFVLVFEVFH